MSVKLVLNAIAIALVTLTVAGPASAQRGDRDRDRYDDRDRDRDRGRDDRGRDDRRGDDHRRDDWVLIGSQQVQFRGDRDSIRVGRRDGRFESLVLSVKDGDVEIRDMTVIYGNGERQSFTVNGVIQEGQRTRPIDLRGGDRVIDRIEFVYRSRGRWRGGERATVEVYGRQHERHAGPPGRPGWGGRSEWVELGCRAVALIGADRDVIPVGRREGRFKAVKFRAEGEKIRLLNARVIYANGQPDDLRIDVDLPRGSETQPIPVRGRTRSISQIEIVSMKKRLSLKKVHLCAYGLQ